jgi:hypothetical protein
LKGQSGNAGLKLTAEQRLQVKISAPVKILASASARLIFYGAETIGDAPLRIFFFWGAWPQWAELKFLVITLVGCVRDLWGSPLYIHAL